MKWHLYHHQVNDSLFSTSKVPWYNLVWREGLATYVSQQLNPGTTAATALLSEDLATNKLTAVKALACQILALADTTKDSDISTYIYAGQNPAGLPTRGGYLIGFEMAQKLGATRTLRELALLKDPDLRTQILTQLTALCTQPASRLICAYGVGQACVCPAE